MSQYESVKRLVKGPTHYSITDLCARLPEGTVPEVISRGRTAGAVPDPDVQLSIVTPGRSKSVPAWEVERIRPWLARVEETTRGYPLRFRHLKFLRLDHEAWWDVRTDHLATAADIRAVCPGTTKEAVRWRLRKPGAWWHEEAVTVGNRTGWTIPVTRRIIDDLALGVDLDRWAHLVALALVPDSDDRDAHLAALTTDNP